jgi:hypothetical protein
MGDTDVENKNASSNIDSEASQELLIKAYERSASELNSHARSVFDDVKLLAAVGAMVAWGPLQIYLFGDGKGEIARASIGGQVPWLLFGESPVPLFGFVAILIVLAVIGLRDIVKSAFIVYYVDYLVELENLLETRFHLVAPHGLRKWKKWHKAVHGPQQLIFRLFICSVTLLLPTSVFAVRECTFSLAVYVFVFTIVVLVMLLAQKKLSRMGDAR